MLMAEPAQQCPPPVEWASGQRRWVEVEDLVIVLAFLVFAVAFQLERWKGYNPFIYLDTDAGQITSFAAGWAHPDLFEGDALLGNPQRYRFYTTIHIPLIILLGKLTGSYGTGFIALLGLHVFLMNLGFYVLGRAIFQNRLLALVLSLLVMPQLEAAPKEIWGIMYDPLPGFTFQALAPFLMASLFYYRRRPGAWPWLMILAGALVYFHPVSAPSCCAGVWLGFWLMLPAAWSRRQKLIHMARLAAVLVAVAMPFALWYLHYHDTGQADPLSAPIVDQALRTRMAPVDLSPVLAVQSFGRWLNTDFPYAYAGLGAAVLVLVLRRDDRRSVLMVLMWIVGIVLFSAGVPMLGHVLSRALNRTVPLQIDLARPLKYVVPYTMLFLVWLLAELWHWLDRVRWREWARWLAPPLQVVLSAAGLCMVAFWHYRYPDVSLFPLPTVQAWREGRWYSEKSILGPIHLAAIQKLGQLTPPRSRIFATNWGIAIRYTALRPVVYTYKDGGPFIYSDSRSLVKWYETFQRVGRLPGEGPTPELLVRIVPAARDLGAEYLFLSLTQIPDAAEALASRFDMDLVWTDLYYAVYRFHPSAG